MVAKEGKYLGVEGERMELGVEVAASLGAEYEFDDRPLFPQSFVRQLIVGLNRRQKERANDERNEQARDALTNVVPRRAAPQREPTGRPGHQEEERHPPEREKPVKEGRQGARFGVVNMPNSQSAEWRKRVKDEHSQDG